MKDTVYVFARPPRLGAVKRRLARDIGEMPALRFYRQTLSRTLRTLARDPRFRTVIAAASVHEATRWPVPLQVVRQCPGDIGRRMDRVFRRHGRGRAAIVGSDIPHMCRDDVAAAFRALGRADACFGPASDGGYWLVAMGPRRPAAPFAAVRWSTDQALHDTLRNFKGKRVAMGKLLDDVDTGADLAKVMAH